MRGGMGDFSEMGGLGGYAADALIMMRRTHARISQQTRMRGDLTHAS